MNSDLQERFGVVLNDFFDGLNDYSTGRRASDGNMFRSGIKKIRH